MGDGVEASSVREGGELDIPQGLLDGMQLGGSLYGKAGLKRIAQADC